METSTKIIVAILAVVIGVYLYRRYKKKTPAKPKAGFRLGEDAALPVSYTQGGADFAGMVESPEVPQAKVDQVVGQYLAVNDMLPPATMGSPDPRHRPQSLPNTMHVTVQLRNKNMQMADYYNIGSGDGIAPPPSSIWRDTSDINPDFHNPVTIVSGTDFDRSARIQRLHALQIGVQASREAYGLQDA